MRALTAGLRSVGLCVSRRLPRRAPAGLPQNKENPTKLQGDDIAHAVRSALENLATALPCGHCGVAALAITAAHRQARSGTRRATSGLPQQALFGVLPRIPQHPVDVAVSKTRAPCDPPFINATAPKLDHDRARLPVPLLHSFDAGRGKTPCFLLVRGPVHALHPDSRAR